LASVVADVERVAVQPDALPLLDPVEYLGADVVDQRDARLDQEQRAAVRVPAADALGHVDHRADAAADERVRPGQVEVFVVDDGDVSGAQPVGQVLGPAVQPSRRSYTG
jgi:hypothetical protein